MADIINASSGYQTGSIDTATTLVNNVSSTDAKHINGPAGAIVQIETILGSGTTLKGSAADLATRLGIAVEANGKLKDFSATTKSTFPVTVAEAGTGATSFTDGAVLVGNGTNAIQALALPAAFKVLTHSGTAGADPTWASGLLYQGPITTGAGSTASQNGAITIVGNQNLSGINYYTNFTLNSGVTITVPAGKRRVVIVASGTITINGTINAANAGGAGGASGAPASTGAPGTDQAGGGGGGDGGGNIGGNGGSVLRHGVTLQAGGAGATINGGTATQLTGSDVAGLMGNPLDAMGGAGGGGSFGIAGGAGGGSIVLIAPTIVLAATATLNTSGETTNSASYGAGGGGAGNVYIITRSYTDNGCTFTLAGGAADSGGSSNGGAGATGIKQINIYD